MTISGDSWRRLPSCLDEEQCTRMRWVCLGVGWSKDGFMKRRCREMRADSNDQLGRSYRPTRPSAIQNRWLNKAHHTAIQHFYRLSLLASAGTGTTRLQETSSRLGYKTLSWSGTVVVWPLVLQSCVRVTPVPADSRRLSWIRIKVSALWKYSNTIINKSIETRSQTETHCAL